MESSLMKYVFVIDRILGDIGGKRYKPRRNPRRKSSNGAQQQ
jgi:hypothetical protein